MIHTLNMDYDAVIYQFDEQITAVAYENTDHYQISKYFLMNRERFLQQLFAEEED